MDVESPDLMGRRGLAHRSGTICTMGSTILLGQIYYMPWFFVVCVVVEFGGVEGAGMKSNGMDFSICSENQENGRQSVIGGVRLEDHLCIRYPLGEYWCMSEFFLELLEGVATFFVEVPRGAFSG